MYIVASNICRGNDKLDDFVFVFERKKLKIKINNKPFTVILTPTHMCVSIYGIEIHNEFSLCALMRRKNVVSFFFATIEINKIGFAWSGKKWTVIYSKIYLSQQMKFGLVETLALIIIVRGTCIFIKD
jgi:hypothetical protein